MFESIYELPSQVRSSLDNDDQKVFMDAYNELKPKTKKEVNEAMRKAWIACKTLPSSFSFEIIASVEDVDNDNELIDIKSVKDHMDSFIEYGGNIQDDHASYQLGVIWDWEPIKKDGKDGIVVWGNLFGGDEVYDEARKAFIKGTNNLSIAGQASKGKFQCDSRGCYVRRNVKQLLEISLCKVPANKHCKMQWYNENAKLTKSSKDEIRLSVNEYTLHKDYTTCPIRGLEYKLRKSGIEAHAKYDGVFVPVDPEDLEKTEAICKSIGLVCEPYEGGLLLNEKNALVEKYFKDGIAKGYLDRGGNLTNHITKSQFDNLNRKGLLVRDGNLWSLVMPDMI